MACIHRQQELSDGVNGCAKRGRCVASIREMTVRALAGERELVACQGCLFRELIPGTEQAEWNVSMKSRGFGDTIRKFTQFTGIDRAVHAVATATGVDCGCGGRQESLNQALPYKG